MKLNKYLYNVSAVVINLKKRPDQKEYIEKQLKNRKIEYSFYMADKHTDPKRGCLESHINIIANSNAQNLLIMEDDCKFIRDFQVYWTHFQAGQSFECRWPDKEKGGWNSNC